MSRNDKIRTEIHLDVVADTDILEDIERTGMQRATYFKYAARELMKRREEEAVDERVKRLINELLTERGEIKPVQKVENKTRLAFGVKKT